MNIDLTETQVSAVVKQHGGMRRKHDTAAKLWRTLHSYIHGDITLAAATKVLHDTRNLKEVTGPTNAAK